MKHPAVASLAVALVTASGVLAAAQAMAPSNRTPSNRTVVAAETPPPAAAKGAPPPYIAPKADAALAPAGNYAIDKGHTSVTGKIRREGLSNYTFRFDKLDAKFSYDPAKPEASQVEVVLDPKSVDANNATWTEHLQANDLLNTANFHRHQIRLDRLQADGRDHRRAVRYRHLPRPQQTTNHRRHAERRDHWKSNSDRFFGHQHT